MFVTVLGFVLQGNPGERHRILDGALGQFPIISDQLKLESLNGSGVGLAIGAFGSVLAGLGITGATQNAFNRIWNVPLQAPPQLPHARLRGLGMLAMLGTLAIVSTTAAGFVGAQSHGAPDVAGGILVAFVFNLALFMTAFKLLTAVEVCLARPAPRRDRRGRLLAAAPAPRRLLRRPRLKRTAPSTACSRSCSACSPGCISAPS